MRLRARFANETAVIGQSLTAQSSLAELRRDLAAALKSLDSSSSFKIKTGFPPKFIANGDADSLAACGIKDGEQLIVELSDAVAASGGGSVSPVKTSGAFSFGSASNSSTQQQVPPPPAPVHPAAPQQNNDECVPVTDGFLKVREMKDDNSCLFHAVSHVLTNSQTSTQELRTIIATHISKHTQEYSATLLGRPIPEYVAWIQSPNSWGGAIELAIFSAHFETEIWSLDVATCRIDQFGEGSGYSKIVILFYSGIHYDAVVVSPLQQESGDSGREFDMTVFGREQAEGQVKKAALELAQVWRRKRKFTDLSSFTLRCSVCRKGLTGQKEAQGHSIETGHGFFEEY
ncbi:hypothetical protein BDR26DRAFT_821001 [Obelidium mucronatum]|nr:hypothetical protein BDR26DRAFT_821001 [Obelidium mucronatum]